MADKYKAIVRCVVDEENSVLLRYDVGVGSAISYSNKTPCPTFINDQMEGPIEMDQSQEFPL
jgi:hypothetical protein